MKTGLTKKQKITCITFDEDSSVITISTYNTDLKNRLIAFADQYPAECELTEENAQGRKTFAVQKGRFGFKLTAPYSEERRRAASKLAKEHSDNLRRSVK